ncbi:prephenate dehydrogenase/arogenate dehydrogenase family protein [Frankia sp. AgPm24]|uniref:prephenate dehydrogenase/arogenate dehydrogenase family protein n=1 Tax=Frankia sp. AgPm24 TaxID=631128 RepID=UPI00200E7B1C|nr:prephenate dehydrogenase/arogenate dehydrogenase family protein [Frankia sp. AgPm24]
MVTPEGRPTGVHAACELARFRVLVVGAGLIGTSIGLALRRRGADVLLADHNTQRVETAARRGAGRPWSPDEPGTDPRGTTASPRVDHVVLAVPPRQIGQVLLAWQRLLPNATFSDTASVKVQPLDDARRLGADLTSMCGAHPVAGGERSGPEAAAGDIFRGQPWVLTPLPTTSTLAREHARLVAVGCGASIVQLDPQTHDLALGLLSHLPHVIASAVAARLALVSEDVVKLAGPGLMDFTRIAGANADLWTDIVAANASPIAGLLTEVVADLVKVCDALGDAPASAIGHPVVESLFRLGNTGRHRLESARPGQGLRATGTGLLPVQAEPPGPESTAAGVPIPVQPTARPLGADSVVVPEAVNTDLSTPTQGHRQPGDTLTGGRVRTGGRNDP